ncbi:predicted protein [Postia placenta Mad-698-R]|nr:predicted protein [Postia placenta Mad-698-R]
MPRSTTILADWQPNPGWTPKESCRQCGSSRHWVRDCPDVRCAGCGKEAPGHLERECRTRPMKRHVSAPPEEPARRMGVVVDNVFIKGIINEAKERKEKKRQMKAVPIPPPRSANPEPPASPVAGSSRPYPDTPIVFRKVDPDWTPDSTQWTWDSSWPHQKHLSGKEWKNMGRNARKEWFDEEEDDGVDWELYGNGEHHQCFNPNDLVLLEVNIKHWKINEDGSPAYTPGWARWRTGLEMLVLSKDLPVNDEVFIAIALELDIAAPV